MDLPAMKRELHVAGLQMYYSLAEAHQETEVVVHAFNEMKKANQESQRIIERLQSMNEIAEESVATLKANCLKALRAQQDAETVVEDLRIELQEVNNINADLIQHARSYRKQARVCHWCCNKGKHQCNRCHLAFYCSTECQRTDWKRHHKYECASIASKDLEFGCICSLLFPLLL